MENSEECKTDHTKTATTTTRAATATNQNYVSCIKIHGLEILPPILTDEKRKCMQYYRDLAIQVEEKIKSRKCKKIHDDTTESEHSATYNDSEVSSISDSVVYSSDKSSNDELTFRSVVFTNSCRSDILHMLNDSEKNTIELKNSTHAAVEIMPLLDDKSAIKNVPSNLNLNSSNDVESDMIKCFENESDTILNNSSSPNINNINVDDDQQLPKCKTNISLTETNENNCQPNNNTNTNNNNNNNKIESSVDLNESLNEDITIITESTPSPPPLIRRNSYILENPSPYLLALINQNNTESSVIDKPSPNSNSGQHKRRRWNLEKAREKWSSIEQDLNHVVRKNSAKRNDINFNSLPTSPEAKMFDSTLNKITSSKTQLPEKESDIPTNDKPKLLNNTNNNNNKSVQNVRDSLVNGSESKSETPSNRFIRSYATPLRKPNPQKRIESKIISPIKTPDKTKRVFDTSMQSNKKTDLIGKSTLIKQRKLSFDELKQNNKTKINSTSPPHKSNSQIAKSPKCLKSSPVKSTKSSSILVSKKTIPEQQIREMINKISHEQSNQMAMLLEKQRAEQEHLMKLFAEQQTLLLAKLRCTYQNSIETNVNQTESVIDKNLQIETLNNSEKALMECRKVLDFETSYADSTSSPDDSLQTISPPSNHEIERSFISSRQYSFHLDFNRNSKQSDIQIIDLELTGGPATTSSSKYTCSTDSLDVTTVKTLEKKRSLNRVSTTCSRQLFPTEKQIWAATKLCAATKGFLVRRLIKTERVQNLVKTIRDSLLCAMELHHEKADNIQPADVELHRRLIQQVTAACYTFHDTFFDLTTSEQMSVIAFDRERQKEKMLRPASAKSNSSLSSTTQRVLERKLKRRSSDSMSGNQSRCSSSRSSYNVGDFRPRTKSLGMQEPPEHNNPKKTSPSNDVITHRTMSYGANKKPWR